MALTKKGQLTQQAIVDQAIEIIEEHGEVALRVQDLAERTGASISSIYYFFTDREGLIAAAQAERYSRRPGQDHRAARGGALQGGVR